MKTGAIAPRLLIIATMCSAMFLLPLQSLAQPQGGSRCFAETSLCISGRIGEFWEQNGGLAVFGFPTSAEQTETIEGRALQVQHFERHRLELHPENPRPYDVLLGRLGAEQMAQMRLASLHEDPQAGCIYFGQTTHLVCGAFARAWQANGVELDGLPGASFEESLALFGLPLSAPMGLMLSDGQAHTVQFFERARFELHLGNAPPFDVLFGLLDNEARGANGPRLPSPLLPAPLYFGEGSRIVRLERNGVNQSEVLDAGAGQITAVSVAPNGQELAYVLKRQGGYRLFSADISGVDRRQLHASAQQIEQLIWSPDSAQLAFYNGTFDGRAAGGIFSVPPRGGPVRQLLADDTASAPAVSYLPSMWSPSGARLIVHAVGRNTSGCFLMVLTLDTLELRDPPAPAGRRHWCGALWASDDLLLASVLPGGDGIAAAGLVRVDLRSDLIGTFVAEQSDFGYNLLAYPQVDAGGTLFAFMARAPEPPRLGSTAPISYAPYLIGPDSVERRQLFRVAFPIQELAGWSPDFSGFLLRREAEGGRYALVWAPLNGDAPFEINAPGLGVSWGR
jgi:hypothetical protein